MRASTLYASAQIVGARRLAAWFPAQQNVEPLAPFVALSFGSLGPSAHFPKLADGLPQCRRGVGV
jgi:hypothetical protein